MAYDLDYEADHYCPAYTKVISADLCYDSMMCLNRFFKVSSTKESSTEPESTTQTESVVASTPQSTTVPEETTPSTTSTYQQETQPTSTVEEATTPSSSAAADGSTVTVQPGDGPKQVAERAGITIDQLFALNGLDPNNYMIYPGQQLKVK